MITIVLVAAGAWFFRARIIASISLGAQQQYQPQSGPLMQPLAFSIPSVGAEAAPILSNALLSHIAAASMADGKSTAVVSSAAGAGPALVAALTSTAIADLSPSDVVAKANGSVVSIAVSKMVSHVNAFTGKQQETLTKVSSGSGFFVSKDGLVLTNRHVIDTAGATFTVTTNEGREYSASVLGKDPVLDVAVLKISNAHGTSFPAISIGDSDTLKPGQSVVAIGFVLGQFQNSVSVGVVSGLLRSINADNGQGDSEHLDRVIQTDAAINPGNSGGPLLNLRGQVVGINVATAQGVQSIGFALPINEVKTAIDSVKKYGSIIRPYVGVYYMDIDSDLQEQYNLPVSSGTLVRRTLPSVILGLPKAIDNNGGSASNASTSVVGMTSDAGAAESAVVPGSPAAKAGIKDGDIITAIDGKKLLPGTSFASVIRQKKVGDTVSFTVLRGSASVTIEVTLATATAS